MKVVYQGDSNDKFLAVTDIKITDFAVNTSNYSGIHVKGTLNSETPVEQTIYATSINSTSGVFYVSTSDKTLYINPSFFNLPSYTDCIVRLEVKLIQAENLSSGGAYFAIQNCIFVDVTFKCKVASLLQNIVEENEDIQNKEKVSSFIHLMHYGLTNGSNCGCNCAELIELFGQLTLQLTTVDPKTINPCGCE